ncbi:MAG: hypothetical protein KDJ75_00010 [Alphaproteobacteria bacterium]|nr:hypothetical protein [Alphaproteobacteria bacterium]
MAESIIDQDELWPTPDTLGNVWNSALEQVYTGQDANPLNEMDEPVSHNKVMDLINSL